MSPCDHARPSRPWHMALAALLLAVCGPATGSAQSVGLGQTLNASVAQLSSDFLPSVDDGGQSLIDSRLPSTLRAKLLSPSRRPGIWAGLRRQPSTAPPSSSSSSSPPPSSPSPPYSSECTELQAVTFRLMLAALRASLDFIVQEGVVDFGLQGGSGSCTGTGSEGCAFSNPSSPYGLTMLPLAPEENPAAKAAAQTTPKGVVQDLNGPSSVATPSLAATRIGSILSSAASGSGSSSGGAGGSSSAAGPSPPPPAPAGSAPVYQLRPDEVVLLAGCLPPADASRYFAFTPYIYSAYDHNTSAWVSIFGSMGDSLSVVRQPQPCNATNASSSDSNTNTSNSSATDQCFGNETAGLYGFRNRLNVSLPSDHAGVNGTGDGGSAAGLGSSAGSSSGTGILPAALQALWPWWPTSLLGGGARPAGAAQAAQQSASGLSGGAQGEGEGINGTAAAVAAAMEAAALPPSAFEHFAVVIMTASEESSQQVQAALATVLSSQNLRGAVNVLPIAASPFGASSSIGLDPTDPYYMLMMRNIVPSGSLAAFQSYLQAQPWGVWRLTPRPRAAAVNAAQSLITNLFNSGGGSSSSSSAAEGDSGPMTGVPVDDATYGQYDGFPTPQVVPRTSASTPQSEAWLAPAFNYLQDRVQTRYGGTAQAWSLLSASPLAILGVDWGADCLARMLDICNGDNRDAQYFSAYPLVTMDKTSKVLWLLGVNHVRTGLATYVNVALMDPIAKQGIQAFDDIELEHSADELLAGGPYQDQSPYLFAVRFSRNCTSLSFCKTIPTDGPGGMPLTRPALLMMRAYVNPVTGVGPAPDDILPFRTVVVTPTADARPWDSFARVDPTIFASSPCTASLFSITLCTSPAAVTPGGECCGAGVGAWNQDGCFCSSAGQQLLASLPIGVGSASLVGLGRLCGTKSNVTC